MGKYCNQACLHCHVEAGPGRKEMMERETVEAVLRFLEASQIPTVDITGGAPELNPHFDYLVESCARLGCHVMDRCNLTVIFEPGKEYLPEFFKRNRVEVICSLPCYTEENVDRQRGDGTFDLSIRGLKLLNELGYGFSGTGLELHLVYNPLGAYLPPPQEKLEQDYKRILQEKFGIVFNRLYCLANMPITRFEKFLKRLGQYDQYLDLLERSFNAATLEAVMCRSLLSVGWEGSLYDCDFNQMLDMALTDAGGRPLKIWEISAGQLEGRRIEAGNHCYGCTAGKGSSCGGSLV
jgi:radical SAM/Cys-rich protein